MNEIYEVAAKLQDVLNRNGWAFCFIGALAVNRWGEPRLTGDVDACAFTGFDSDEQLIADLLAEFEPRRPDAGEFALASRVLLIQHGTIGCDVSLGALSFEEEMISRATSFEFLPGIKLQTCSAEDLLVMKAFAGRSKDWSDAEGVLLRQGMKLDLKYVERWLVELCAARGVEENVVEFGKLVRRIHRK